MSPIGHSAMTIEIDTGSGFCFGVTRAIGKAEEELQQGCPLYCLGDIVHNGREVERLRQLGLVTIDHHQFAQLRDANMLLRAHGEPPSTYLQASANHIKLIDARLSSSANLVMQKCSDSWGRPQARQLSSKAWRTPHSWIFRATFVSTAKRPSP